MAETRTDEIDALVERVSNLLTQAVEAQRRGDRLTVLLLLQEATASAERFPKKVEP